MSRREFVSWLLAILVTTSSCAWWQKREEKVIQDLAIDAQSIPCLLQNAPYGVVTAMLECGVPGELEQLVRDLYTGKPVKVARR